MRCDYCRCPGPAHPVIDPPTDGRTIRCNEWCSGCAALTRKEQEGDEQE